MKKNKTYLSRRSKCKSICPQYIVTSILCLLILSCILLTGCRGYMGYRHFNETTNLTTENECIIDTTYDIYLENNKIFACENKKIAYTQNLRVDQIEENLYSECSGGAVIANVIFYPVTLIFSPLALLVYETEEVDFENNKYTYSYGRRIWNFFNIFVRTTGDKKTEREVTDSETKQEDRLRSAKRTLDDANLLVEADGKQFHIKSGTEGKAIVSSIFDGTTAQKTKQIKVTFNRKSKFFLINNTGALVRQ